jgi:hypothetical protein
MLPSTWPRAADLASVEDSAAPRDHRARRRTGPHGLRAPIAARREPRRLADAHDRARRSSTGARARSMLHARARSMSRAPPIIEGTRLRPRPPRVTTHARAARRRCARPRLGHERAPRSRRDPVDDQRVYEATFATTAGYKPRAMAIRRRWSALASDGESILSGNIPSTTSGAAPRRGSRNVLERAASPRGTRRVLGRWHERPRHRSHQLRTDRDCN